MFRRVQQQSGLCVAPSIISRPATSSSCDASAPATHMHPLLTGIGGVVAASQRYVATIQSKNGGGMLSSTRSDAGGGSISFGQGQINEQRRRPVMPEALPAMQYKRGYSSYVQHVLEKNRCDDHAPSCKGKKCVEVEKVQSTGKTMCPPGESLGMTTMNSKFTIGEMLLKADQVSTVAPGAPMPDLWLATLENVALRIACIIQSIHTFKLTPPTKVVGGGGRSLDQQRDLQGEECEMLPSLVELEMLAWQWLGPILDLKEMSSAPPPPPTPPENSISSSSAVGGFRPLQFGDVVPLVEQLSALQSGTRGQDAAKNATILRTVIRASDHFHKRLQPQRNYPNPGEFDVFLGQIIKEVIRWRLELQHIKKLAIVGRTSASVVPTTSSTLPAEPPLTMPYPYPDGAVKRQCDPGRIAAEVIGRVRDQCLDRYAMKPPFSLKIIDKVNGICTHDGSKLGADGTCAGFHIPYVKAHLDYILSEVVKNSMRATLDHFLATTHPKRDEKTGRTLALDPRLLPPVEVEVIRHHDGGGLSGSVGETTRIGGRNGQSGVEIIVRDQGGGIPPSAQARRFGWSTGDDEGDNDASSLHVAPTSDQGFLGAMSGYGCGIPLIYSYAEIFDGGSCEYRSTPGKGTEISVVL